MYIYKCNYKCISSEQKKKSFPWSLPNDIDNKYINEIEKILRGIIKCVWRNNAFCSNNYFFALHTIYLSLHKVCPLIEIYLRLNDNIIKLYYILLFFLKGSLFPLFPALSTFFLELSDFFGVSQRLKFGNLKSSIKYVNGL